MSIYAILIEGDNENTLGGACSRDIWNIAKKIKNETQIKKENFYLFFYDMLHNPFVVKYVEKITQLGIENIYENSIENILSCFQKIVDISHNSVAQEVRTSGITIYFHYSGHGYQIKDADGDEIDGYDELFLGRKLTDDMIWKNFVSLLSKETKLFALIDACHSGSGIDLPYVWLSNKKELNSNNWVLHKKKYLDVKCIGYSISACQDNQSSMQDIGKTTGFSGSLTAGFCDESNFQEFFENPVGVYNKLYSRLKKLNQNVQLYCTKI